MKKYFLFFVIAWSIFIFHSIYTKHAIYGDGNGYYSYTQALYFERSLDFGPIYNYLGHFQGRTGEFSRVFWNPDRNNPFSIGTSVTWLPSMFIMSLFESNRFSLIYELGPGLSGIIFMLSGLYFIEKFLLRRFSKKVVFWTILTLFFGSNIFYYTSFEPALSHQPAFFIVSLLLYLSDNKKVNLFSLGLLSGLLAAIRIGDIILLLPILYAIKDRGLKLINFIGGFLIGVSPQLANQVAQYHGLLVNPYLSGQNGIWQINLGHSIEFLFSPKRGLFTWAPVFLMASWGLIKNNKVIILITLFILFIVASSWEAYLSAGFGQRFMFSAIPYFSIGLAYIYNTFSTKTILKSFSFFSLYNFLLIYGFYILGWKNLPA